MKTLLLLHNYFPGTVPVSRQMWERLNLDRFLVEEAAAVPPIVFVRRIADGLNRLPERRDRPVPAGLLNLYGLQGRIFRYLMDRYLVRQLPGAFQSAAGAAGFPFSAPATVAAFARLADIFPGREVLEEKLTPLEYVTLDDGTVSRKNVLVRELLLLTLARENRALDLFRELFDHDELAPAHRLGRISAGIERHLALMEPVAGTGLPLPQLLRAPLMASPLSLSGQIEFMKEQWGDILPEELLTELLVSLDILREEEREWWSGPGRPEVLQFRRAMGPSKRTVEGEDIADLYPEHERFSLDAGWMPNVVMIAKMTYVWLDQLSRKYGSEIRRLDQVPDEELDLLARWGFSALWLIGVWERSPSSQKIKQIGGNPDAISSAYSLYDYTIAADLGGEAALQNLKDRAAARGIRMASDMVPNHTGLYSRWTIEHPDWFIQLDYPPYPDYSFTGPDLSFSGEITLQIEDGYWDRTNAAVVFRHYDHRNGRSRYIYHGNDGTSTPWNDTAQLNYLLPEVREAVIQTILHVARQFPIIRFDAAMTLAKKHYQRLWFPQPGHGSGVPSRAEHSMSRADFDAVFPEEFWREVVDRVAAEAPDTLLLAEAFWLMEGYFVRTLGMHRVYNSAFMNMLKMEENAKYRQTIKNVLEYDHRILQRFVNFMNNPDERTAVEQFGKEGKYFGSALLLVTMPGLPMFGHGQVEGFHEKYGMEYKRAYWEEPVDEHLVRLHERWIFPLMQRRRLFSGSDQFLLYDFFSGDHVNEDVFAFSNRSGNERGLVLFHNRYATVSGWIRTSSAVAVKNDQGEQTLVTKTLAEGLGFNADRRWYYRFRDSITGLEYLRAGSELAEKGIFIELHAYEFHAFVDFQEIVDDDFGSWGKLCHDLQGRPVSRLDEELKRIRHSAVIELFRVAMDDLGTIDRTLPEKPGQEERERLRAILEMLYEEVNRHTLTTGSATDVAEETTAAVDALPAVSSLSGDETAEERLLTEAWLILHRIGRLAPSGDYAATAAAWYSELGIDVVMRQRLEKESPEIGATACTGLLRLMLSHQLFFRNWPQPSPRARLAELFGDRDAREFLGIHRYQEREWVVRERLEILLDKLLLAAAVTGTVDGEAESVAVMREGAETIKQAARKAGYRVDRILEMLQTREEEEKEKNNG